MSTPLGSFKLSRPQIGADAQEDHANQAEIHSGGDAEKRGANQQDRGDYFRLPGAPVGGKEHRHADHKGNGQDDAEKDVQGHFRILS